MINEELYIDNQLVDIAPNSISISYISPFFNMKGLSNSTYSIKLLDTDNNKKIIKHLNEPDMNTDFPYKYHYADYIKDGELIIDKGEVKVLGDFEIQITFGLNKSKYDILKSDKLNETPITGLESDWIVNWKKSNVVYATGKKFKFIDYTSGKRISELQMDGSVVVSKAIPQEPILSNMKPMTMHPFIPHSSVLSLFNAKVSGLTDYKKTKYNIIGNPNPYRLTINGIAHNIKIGSNIYSLFGIDTHELGYTVVSIVDSSTIQLNIPITLHPENEQTIEVDANTFNSLLTRRLNDGIILNGNKANEKTYNYVITSYTDTTSIRNGFYFTSDPNLLLNFNLWSGAIVSYPFISLAANVSQAIYPAKIIFTFNGIGLRPQLHILIVRRKSVYPYEVIETIPISSNGNYDTDAYGTYGRYGLDSNGNPYDIEITITEEMKDDLFSVEFPNLDSEFNEYNAYGNWGTRPWIGSQTAPVTIKLKTEKSFYYISSVGSTAGNGLYDCIANLPDCTYMEYLQQLAIMSGGFISNDLDKDIRIYYLDEIKSNLAAKNVYDWSGKIDIEKTGEYKFNSLAKKNYIKFNNSKDLTDRDTIIEITDDTIDVEKTLETLIFDSPLGAVDTKSEYILYEQDVKEVTGTEGTNKTFLTEGDDTPTTPYKKGDLWFYQDNTTTPTRFKNKIATANKTSADSYSADDWIEYYDSKSITDLASDGILTPSEKYSIKRIWDAIYLEKPIIDNNVNISGYDDSDEYADYITAFNSLNNYLNNSTNGIIYNLDIITYNIDADELNSHFNTYYYKKEILNSLISNNTLTIANNATTSVNTLNSKITDWASDGKLSPIEKQQLYREWQIIIEEKSKLEIAAGYYSVSTSAYITAYNALDYYLNTNPNVLANLETTTTIVKNDFIAVFTNYTSAKESLNNAIALAAKNFVGTSINNIAIGGRNLLKNSNFAYGLTDWNLAGSCTTLQTKNGYVNSIPYSEHGASGLSTIYSGDVDDTYYDISLPSGFEIYFNGTKYTSCFVGSNSYITFGSGSGSYPVPSIPAILISSSDRRMRKLYAGALDTNRYMVRYEGYSAYGGQPTGNTIIWEAIFYRYSEIVDIQIISNTTVSPQRGVGGLWNGSTFIYENDSFFLGNIGTAFRVNSKLYPSDIDTALLIKTPSTVPQTYNGVYKTYTLDLNEAYILSFYVRLMDGNITMYCGWEGNVQYKSLTGTDWQRVIIPFTPTTQNNLTFYSTTATTFLISNVQLEKGNKVTAYSMTYEDLQSKILELEFIKAAYSATTDIYGGIVATTLIRMRDEYGVYNGGMSGVASDNVGFWTGGTYAQAIAQLANTILNKDGSGQFAGGKIIWDILGRLSVGNFKIEGGQIVGYSGGKDKVRIKNSAIDDFSSLASAYIRQPDDYPLSVSFEYDNSFGSTFTNYTNESTTSGELVILNNDTNVKLYGCSNMVYPNSENVINASISYDLFGIVLGEQVIGEYSAGSTITLDAGTYKIDHKVIITISVDAFSIGSGVISANNAYIEIEQGTERSEIGSNGLYSYFGDTDYFYYRQNYGWQTRQGNFGLQITSSGIKKMINGTDWVNL